MKKAFLTAVTLAVTLSRLSTPALAAKSPPPALTTITTDQNAETFTNSDPNRLVLGDGFGGQGRVIFDYATGELTFDHCNLDKMLGYHEVTLVGGYTSDITQTAISPPSIGGEISTVSGDTVSLTVNTPRIVDSELVLGRTESLRYTKLANNPGTVHATTYTQDGRDNWIVRNISPSTLEKNVNGYGNLPITDDLLRFPVNGTAAQAFVCNNNGTITRNESGTAYDRNKAYMIPSQTEMRFKYARQPVNGTTGESFNFYGGTKQYNLTTAYAQVFGSGNSIGFSKTSPVAVDSFRIIKDDASGTTLQKTVPVFNSRDVLSKVRSFDKGTATTMSKVVEGTIANFSGTCSGYFCNCGHYSNYTGEPGKYSQLSYCVYEGSGDSSMISYTNTHRISEMEVTGTVSQTGTRQVPYNPIVPFSDTRDSTIKSVVFKGCASTISFPRTDTKTVSGYTDTANIWGWMNDVPVTIEGGKYETVNLPAALVTSGNFNSASKFITDGDSTSETANGRTTVKLTNPPIIIDWGEFPGLDIDLSAPTIEVLRNPSDTRTPCTQVTLTISCKDPNGKDDPKPLSINGGAFVASPTTFVATENQQVSIMAKDANGNVREYIATIANIDSAPPEIQGFTQSNDVWTKDPITVTVKATDDTKLHPTAPYNWEFTPNSTGNAGKTTSVWVATKTFRVTENGTVRCQVKDAMDKTTWSEPYPVKCIDTIAPLATATLNPPAGSEGSKTVGVTVSLAINDLADTVTFESSGLSSKPIKWSSTEAWSADTERVFHENGTYNIQVRDAVGNISNPIPITVSNISTSGPVIQEFTGTHFNKNFVKAPVTLTVKGSVSGGKTLPAKPYSWDGGKTWTSVSTQKVMENGEYTVKLRDAVGNVVEASLVVNNIDPVKPTASVYLFKGPPADGSSSAPADYVWKLRVEADDVGSGVESIETLWDSGTHTTLPIIQDIVSPGIYGIIVRDKAGNETYAEKIVTYESLGESAGGGGAGSNQYVDVEVPSTGSAGSHFNAALGDLVYGKTGAYNVGTSTFKAYASGSEGITVNFLASGKSGNWLTGDVTFNGVKYPVKFSGAEGVASGKKIEASCFIPVAGLTTDAKNARIKVVMHEYKDSTKATLVKEGSATLYTSVQVSKPAITYTYSKITDMMTVVGTSSVAGLKTNGLAYQLGGGSSTTYTVPFKVNGATTVKLAAEDCVGGRTEMTLNGNDLQLNGSGGGSLPTEGIKEGNNVNSYRTSNRAAETYIIGGSQSNTDQVPDASVFNQLLGS